MESGSLTLTLIDEDGEPLAGRWSYEWAGRDPLELSIYAVTEISGRPWKWTSRSVGGARLSPARCRALAARIGNALRKDARAPTAAVIARIIAHEAQRPGQKAPDQRVIVQILAGQRAADWDVGPQETTPAMLCALRVALRAARESEAGLEVKWGRDDDDD